MEELEATVADAKEVPAQMFLIDKDEKRTVKSSCNGQVIDALRRAKAPLSLNAIVGRIKGSKAGKALELDVKARTKKCAEWWVNHSPYVRKTEQNEYFLVKVVK